jgi:hypothetical protein
LVHAVQLAQACGHRAGQTMSRHDAAVPRRKLGWQNLLLDCCCNVTAFQPPLLFRPWRHAWRGLLTLGARSAACRFGSHACRAAGARNRQQVW